MKLIVLKTRMATMPQNCKECEVKNCFLPEGIKSDKILKPYLKKRHEKCPLVEAEIK